MKFLTDKTVIISLVFLFLSHIIYSQSMAVIDPILTGTLLSTHTEQQNVLKQIMGEEIKIRNFQALINIKLLQMKLLQEKTYKYLSTVNSVVRNGKDIIYASSIAKDIGVYQKEAYDLSREDPKLLLVAAKAQYELSVRSVDLLLYINSFALKGGENNLLDNKQRIDMCIHVVKELQLMRGNAMGLRNRMRYAKRAGVLKTLYPMQFRYVNNGKAIADQIIKDIKIPIKY